MKKGYIYSIKFINCIPTNPFYFLYKTSLQNLKNKPMGLSIHYNGYLKNAELLPDLIREVKDTAEIYGWKHHIFETEFPNDRFNDKIDFEKLYGISFTPENSETVSFVFLSNGRMVCPVRVSLSDNDTLNERDSWVYSVSVKTQFAGVKMHQLLIHLFRYLNDHYFRDFEMFDESYYWETNDEEKMQEQFKTYVSLLDNFELALQTFPMEKDEDIEQYFERMMKHVKNLKK